MTTDSQTRQLPVSSKDLCTLFSFAFGFYLGIHMLLIEELSPSWFIILPPLAGLWLMFKPSSVGRFMFAVVLSLADSWIAMPVRSNSTMLTFLTVLFIIIAFAGLVWKHRSVKLDGGEIFDRFAPGGRLALLTMYFFGIFQKINHGFLDPETSCATLMMTHFTYLPLSFTTHPVVQHIAIHGTFAVEGLILILLIKPSWRYAGVIIGLAFHLMLSLNDFQYFQPFTMMAFLLHFLFLDRDVLNRWRASTLGVFFTSNAKWRTGIVTLWASGWGIFVLSWQMGWGISPYWSWLPFALFILWFVVSFGRPKKLETDHHFFLSQNWLITILATVFFIQCFSPYVGFKTQQTVNMFSSLRTEGGISNHLIFQKPIPLFNYQNDLVTILDSNDPWLLKIRDTGNEMVALDFFNYLARNPVVMAKYVHKGQEFEHTELTPEKVSAWKLSTFANKFMVFQTVPKTGKMPCLAD